MAQTVPVSFRASPLPFNADYTPQQFLDALVARLSLESSVNISFFTSGPTAPTSDYGPWLKNGITWYVWDTATAQYVPQVIEFQSLKYIFQNATPDQNKYTFWGQLDGSGKAQSVQYYYSGAWHDVYEDKFALYSTTAQMNTAISTALSTALANYSTTAQMNTAIADAIAAAPEGGAGAFEVQSNADQTITFVADGTQIVNPVYGQTNTDPDGCFYSNNFTAKKAGWYMFFATAQTEVNDAHVLTLETIIYIQRNGFNVAEFTNGDDAALGTKVDIIHTGPIQLSEGDSVNVALSIAVTRDATTSVKIDAGTGTKFSGFLMRSAS